MYNNTFIHSIRTSINSLLQPPSPPSTPLPASTPAVPLAPAPAPEPETSWESDPSEYLEEEEEEEEEVNGEEKEVDKEEFSKGEADEVKSPPLELKSRRSKLEIYVKTMDTCKGEGESEGEEVKSPPSEVKSSHSELEILCETMNHRGLRKYMLTHISGFRGLREQHHKPLRLSPNPATLVFKCISKFYLKIGKRNDNDSPLSRGWKVKVLLLECLLLMNDDKGVEIEKWVKEDAEQAALTWLNRMNSEGGKPQEIDARGLLLFIGCFGIPDEFTNANIRNLLQLSNLKWASDALKRSDVLMAKFPEIIEEMVADKGSS